MAHDFDRTIDRRGTDSLKWDLREKLFRSAEVLPMWVADMDFEAPSVVVDALRQRVEHGVFGYTEATDRMVGAAQGWLQTRYGWSVEKEWILYSPGVVSTLSLAVVTFTEPGEKVVIQPPVYPPFKSVVTMNDREVVYNPLRLDNDTARYSIDFDHLDSVLSDERVKLMILCNPHNPVGRVWTREELTEIGRRCLAHGVKVVSDEIHADLVYPGQTFIPFASIHDDIACNTLACIAPTKTFNIAGLHISLTVIPDKELRKTFSTTLRRLSLGSPNLLSVAALEAAYTKGGPWLDQLLTYLQGNLDEVVSFAKKRLPGVRVIPPEGTYLVWLDCRELGLTDPELETFFLEEAKVAFNQGHTFGIGGEGFVRMNIGCPRSVLREGLQRMEQALAKRSTRSS